MIEIDLAIERFQAQKQKGPPQLRPEFMKWYKSLGGLVIAKFNDVPLPEHPKWGEIRQRAEEIKGEKKGTVKNVLEVLHVENAFDPAHRDSFIVGLWGDRHFSNIGYLANLTTKVRQETGVPIAGPKYSYAMGVEKSMVGGVRLALLERLKRESERGRGISSFQIAAWFKRQGYANNRKMIAVEMCLLKKELAACGYDGLIKSEGCNPVWHSLASW